MLISSVKTNAWMMQIMNSNIEYPPPVMMGRIVEENVIVDNRVNATVVLIIPRIT